MPRRTPEQIAAARKRSLARWIYQLRTKYNLSPEEYWLIYESQGGVCYICRRATGKTRRLCVDHDHKTGFVRGLLCNRDNKLLGWARDAVDFFQRCIDYLTNPPAFAVIGKRKVPEEKEAA